MHQLDIFFCISNLEHTAQLQKSSNNKKQSTKQYTDFSANILMQNNAKIIN